MGNKSSKKKATKAEQVSKPSLSEHLEPKQLSNTDSFDALAMSSKTRDDRWKSLQNIPFNIHGGNGVMLNDHEFVWLSYSFGELEDDHSCKAMHKYDVYTNEWCEFIDYPKDLKIYYHDIAFHEETNKLYILGAGTGMIIVDIKTQKFQTDLSEDNAVRYPCLLNVNGIIHKIAGWNSAQHSVWNDNDNLFEQIYNFEEQNSIYGASAIYVPSKQIILLIGGRDDYIKDNHKMLGNIWKYCLVSNKWHKINGLIFDYYYHSAVLSLNEEYVVIVGGFDEGRNRVDVIHVLDIRIVNNFILRECSIKIPLTGHHIMFRSVVSGGGLEDELLISGWIKSVFKLPPLEIMELIKMFYFKESIHLIRLRLHFVINIQHILSSLL